MYGGDDGARTRDLCRDSYANVLHLNDFMGVDGYQQHPKALKNIGKTVHFKFQHPHQHPHDSALRAENGVLTSALSGQSVQKRLLIAA